MERDNNKFSKDEFEGLLNGDRTEERDRIIKAGIHHGLHSVSRDIIQLGDRLQNDQVITQDELIHLSIELAGLSLAIATCESLENRYGFLGKLTTGMAKMIEVGYFIGCDDTEEAFEAFMGASSLIGESMRAIMFQLDPARAKQAQQMAKELVEGSGD